MSAKPAATTKVCKLKGFSNCESFDNWTACILEDGAFLLIDADTSQPLVVVRPELLNSSAVRRLVYTTSEQGEMQIKITEPFPSLQLHCHITSLLHRVDAEDIQVTVAKIALPTGNRTEYACVCPALVSTTVGNDSYKSATSSEHTAQTQDKTEVEHKSEKEEISFVWEFKVRVRSNTSTATKKLFENARWESVGAFAIPNGCDCERRIQKASSPSKWDTKPTQNLELDTTKLLDSEHKDQPTKSFDLTYDDIGVATLAVPVIVPSLRVIQMTPSISVSRAVIVGIDVKEWPKFSNACKDKCCSCQKQHMKPSDFVTLNPCRHRVWCKTCAQTIAEKHRKEPYNNHNLCPVCRQGVFAIVMH